MKFFLDENFPKAGFGVLEGFGHEVIDSRASGLQGSPDKLIFDSAQAAQAMFVTTDHDFYHTIPHLYSEHCGVVVIALKQPNRSNILSRLSWFIKEFDESKFANRAFQLRDRSWVTAPPIGE